MFKARATKYAAGLGAVAALALGGAAFAAAGGGEDEAGASGPGANRARAAALAHLPGGKANSVERDSENGAVWEVEVTKADGETVDVRLSAAYEVVVVEHDDEGAEGSGEDADEGGER